MMKKLLFMLAVIIVCCLSMGADGGCDPKDYIPVGATDVKDVGNAYCIYKFQHDGMEYTILQHGLSNGSVGPMAVLKAETIPTEALHICPKCKQVQ